jgi:MFS family permease
MWLQAIFGATAILFEFPSGYVADRLGHRRSLLTGALFWLAAVSLLSAPPNTLDATALICLAAQGRARSAAYTRR